ncbi:MAG: peptidoglycan-associated lipoprotein Pal [Terriglobales bacterium]
MQNATSQLRITAVTLGSALVVCLGLAGCGHKPTPPPPVPQAPPPAAAPQVTVSLAASPSSVVSGAASTLTWTSANATSVELNGSTVNLNGSQSVSPTQSTTYHVIAHGANGQTATADADVQVTQPPAPETPPAPAATPVPFDEAVKDAFFDYDKSDIRPDAESALQSDADYLKSHPELAIRVVGHCDERGSAEYNLALGQRRAEAVKNYLVSQGIDASRVITVSVGKEQPFCTETTDDCYQQNRRGHFTAGQQ